MAESTGKKLAKARLAKGLTVDEAAHATKLRPDKIIALENDDYSRFPNNAYGRGFLQIYARYLQVDVNDFARTLETSNPVSIAEYQYLSNTPAASAERFVARHESRKPSVVPLFVFALLFAGGAYGFYVWLNVQRLEQLDPRAGAAPEASAQSGSEPEVPRPAPAEAPAPELQQPVAPVAPVSAPTLTPSPPVPTGPSVAQSVPAASVAPAAFIHPDSAIDRDFLIPKPAAVNARVNEVILEPRRKTWVKIHKDDPGSQPIFEDYLYPNAPALRLRGARFFVEVREEGAVSIRKNGAPIAYQSPGITIQ
ncbi:MAG: helix-turn-helix domain-containing protein [Verrucomicrobiota bacterium]|nr:helix-turn-helix domain-containing protein [Verrucomicrobiota bacterium]